MIYSWPLVMISVLVAITGSYVALEVNHRLTKLKRRQSRVLWMLVGACTMGIAIWAMHFIGMAAFQLHVPLSYNWLLTFLSILPAVGAAFIAFYVLHKTKVRWSTLLMSGTVMGFGIVSMHYIGMTAVTFAGEMYYTAASMIFAALIAVTVSFAALFLFSYTKNSVSVRLRLAASGLMGLAISSMHYAGMVGTSFHISENMSGLIQSSPAAENNILGITTVFATGTIFVAVQFILYSENRWFTRMNFIDPVTDLPNRRSFDLLEEGKLQQCKAAAYIDVDDYRLLNMSYGLEASDFILLAISERIISLLPSGAALYKLDGSRFAVCIPAGSEEELKKHFTALGTDYQTAFPGSQEEIDISFRVGAVFIEKGKSKSQLFLELDAAVRESYQRETGIVYFHQLEQSLHREELIVKELRQALARKEIKVHYQVKVDTVLHTAHKAEALARWNHAELGFISPGEFIPAAEKYGLIMQLTEYVLDTVCRQLREWEHSAFPMQQIAVNISPIHFQTADANKRLINIVKAHQIAPAKIQLEVTESATMQNVDKAVELLQELKTAGFSIALDDFGTGLSSLTYLQKLPVDTLKIDRSFINRLDMSEADRAIVKLMTDFACVTGLRVVSEGVETEYQLHTLNNIGVQEAQGYYFQKPVRPEEIILKFQQSKHA